MRHVRPWASSPHPSWTPHSPPHMAFPSLFCAPEHTSIHQGLRERYCVLGDPAGGSESSPLLPPRAELSMEPQGDHRPCTGWALSEGWALFHHFTNLTAGLCNFPLLSRIAIGPGDSNSKRPASTEQVGHSRTVGQEQVGQQLNYRAWRRKLDDGPEGTPVAATPLLRAGDLGFSTFLSLHSCLPSSSHMEA